MKPDKLTELFERLENTAQKSQLKANRPSTPILDYMLTIPSTKKPAEGIKVTASIPSAAPAASTTASESRIAAAVLDMLQKSLGKPAQTGLAPLLTAAAARHDAAIAEKQVKQAKGIPVPQNSHLTGLARLIANSKGDSSKSSTVPNAPLRM